MKVRRGRRDRKCHDRASLSHPLVLSLGPLTSLTSFPLFCISENINGRGRGGPLTRWGWRGRGPIVMTFSDVFLPVPFLASPFNLHRINRPKRPGRTCPGRSRGIPGSHHRIPLPSRPKLLQKTSLQKKSLEAINFVIITKTLCIQLKPTRERPRKHYKNNCFRELSCNNFGQDGYVIFLYRFLICSPCKRFSGLLYVRGIQIAKFRRGSNALITPFKTHRADFKIAGRSREDRGRSRKIEGARRDRGEIEERSRKDRGRPRKDRGNIDERSRKDRGNYVSFSELFLGNSRDAGVLGIFGRMVCADGLRFGARFRL